jgi:acyl-CoA reductase-like NAD-dependent aldehyde dehydrogenase
MTATRTPGLPAIEDGRLISTNPATGDEVGRFPVMDAAEVDAAVARARDAALWWAGRGFVGRRARLLRFRSVLANRLPELAALMRAEGGKPEVDAVTEVAAAIDHVAWAARNARRVLRLRKVRGAPLQLEYTARLEYQPYGVIGVLGPWNYPVYTPLGSLACPSGPSCRSCTAWARPGRHCAVPGWTRWRSPARRPPGRRSWRPAPRPSRRYSWSAAARTR